MTRPKSLRLSSPPRPSSVASGLNLRSKPAWVALQVALRPSNGSIAKSLSPQTICEQYWHVGPRIGRHAVRPASSCLVIDFNNWDQQDHGLEGPPRSPAGPWSTGGTSCLLGRQQTPRVGADTSQLRTRGANSLPGPMGRARRQPQGVSAYLSNWCWHRRAPEGFFFFQWSMGSWRQLSDHAPFSPLGKAPRAAGGGGVPVAARRAAPPPRQVNRFTATAPLR
jgi:hypothetical protein